MIFNFTKYQVYTSKCVLYNYNGNSYRLVLLKSSRNSGFEDNFNKTKNTFIDYNNLESERCSLSRTKRVVREIALCNDFQYFVTLTVNSKNADRFSLDEVQSKCRKVLHKIKRKNKDFKFLLITECHKNGAFHFHGLMSNIPDIYKNQNGYFSSRIFDDELGFNSFSLIRDNVKCCNYITKYITKNCVKNSNNQIYFCSRGLNRATKETFEPFDFDFKYENDFCKIRDFTLDTLTDEEKFFLFNLKEK